MSEVLPESTRAWMERVLGHGATVVSTERLLGGWSSEMRRIEVRRDGVVDTVVLRSFTRRRYLPYAEAMLQREAAILELLKNSAIPAARVLGLDALGEHCAAPSLVRTHLPGAIRLQDDASVTRRCERLAQLLVAIHRVRVTDLTRPRRYEAWTRHDRVRVPGTTARNALWQRAIDVIRAAAPEHEPCFLHRDFHPGNVLFDDHGVVTGVVDWVETSWGPADLDVAHCSTSLALLHGIDCAIAFSERYVAAGGRVAAEPRARLYWYLIDALAFAPDAEKVATAWLASGRADLTPAVASGRLEDYIAALMDRFGA